MTQNKYSSAIRSILIAALLLGTSNYAFSEEKVPYNQYVFPPDLHAYPLLFANNVAHDFAGTVPENESTGNFESFINNFIEKQKKKSKYNTPAYFTC